LGQAVNFAQIQGHITDPAGAAVNGAKVTATQTETGLVREVTTNTEGNYILPRLPVGPYKLEIKAPDFRDYVQTGIVLQVNEQPTINIALTLGAVSEKVEVNAAAALVETNDNSVSEVIDNARILDMPLNGRQASQLILLAGAANNTPLSGQDLTGTKTYGNTSDLSGLATISVAGSQENANNYLLDGGDNNNAFSNVALPFPFPDAIQEFSVQESMLSAQYGLHAGAVVNVVTKSGTNAIHGDAFEFVRNQATNAKPDALTQTPTADTLKRNQFGGTVGGPIIKDKLFSFLGYQGSIERSLGAQQSEYIPTAAELSGDWSTRESASITAADKAAGLTTPCQTKAATITNPFTGKAFSGAQVNPNLYNPAALKIAQNYLATADANPCGLIGYQVNNNYNENQGIAKVDYNASSRNSIFARYFISDFQNPMVFQSQNIAGTTATPGQDDRVQTLALGDTYTFNSGIVNSLHLTGTRLRINRTQSEEMPNPTDLGITMSAPISNVFIMTGPFTIMGGSAAPGHFNTNTLQGADDINIMHGKHQFSLGINTLHYQLNYLSLYQSNGNFTFGGGTGFSGDTMLDFLLGEPSTFLQSNNEAENWRQTYIGAYANDNIRIKPNFTVNAGIRWDPYMPAADEYHRGSHFDVTDFENNVHSTVFPGAPAGLFYCGDPQTPCSYINSHLANFAPRVGMVWDPKGDGKSSLRSGFGIFYDNPEIFFMDRFADNAPFGSVGNITFNPALSTNFSAPYGVGNNGPYPLPFPPTQANAFFPNAATATTAANGGGGIFINMPLNMHPTEVQQWNLSYEKQVGANWMLSATYLGSHTEHIWVSYEGDPSCPAVVNGACSLGTGQGSSLAKISSPGAPTAFQNVAPTTSNATYRQYLYLLNPSQGAYFNNMTTANDGATASYNGLLLTAKHRFSQNFTSLTNFTWSHCISDGDFLGEAATGSRDLQSTFVLDPNALREERGNCGFDVRRILNTSVVATSPKFNGLTGMLANNWQLAPLFSYRSGTWFQVTESTDNSLTGIKRDRPDVVGDPNAGTCTGNVAVGTTGCWFNTSAYVLQPLGTFGNATRNMLQGPRAFTLDASLSRSFKIHENQSLMLRFEAFNVMNHPNLGNPASSCSGTAKAGATSAFTCSGFGTITTTASGTAGNPRQFQGALKYTF